MFYIVNMRQTNVMRKTIVVEAESESDARRAAYLIDSGTGYKLDPNERRRRYIESIRPLTVEDLDARRIEDGNIEGHEPETHVS